MKNRLLILFSVFVATLALAASRVGAQTAPSVPSVPTGGVAVPAPASKTPAGKPAVPSFQPKFQPKQEQPLTPEERFRAAWASANRDYPRANVDGTIISFFEVQKVVTPLAPAIWRSVNGNVEYFNIEKSRLMTQYVQDIADRKLLNRAFVELGGTFPPAFFTAQIEERIQTEFNGDRAAYFNSLRQRGITPLEDRRQFEEIFIMQQMQREAIKYLGEPGPKRIEEFYEKNKQARFTRPEQIRYRQIQLTADADETNADVFARRDLFLEALKKKSATFPELVKTRFNKAASRDDDGGANQWLNTSDLNEKVLAALKAVKDGEVTAPVDLTGADGRAAVFLFQRVEFRAGGAIPLAEVQDQIAAELSRVEQNAAVERMLERLRQKYFVRYY